MGVLRFNKKTKIISLSIVGALFILRLLLPYFVLNYANKVLSNMDEYHGHIRDINFSLYRGAFTVYDLVIEKENTNIPVPFFTLKQVDLSIHWAALLNGAIVGEVIAEQPVINFAIDATGQETQTGIENNWVKTLRELTPLDINLNLLSINHGAVYFKDFSKNPTVDVYIENFNLRSSNLSNVVNENKKYPAYLMATGQTIGNGKLFFASKLNILKPIPDFNADFKLEDAALNSLNDFSNAYGKFDFEEGTFSIYSEMIMDNNAYVGYVKPMFEKLNIIKKGSDKDRSLLNRGWQLFLDGVTEVFENQKKDRLATKAPISGNIKETDVSVFTTIINTLRNAFVKALPKKIDESFTELYPEN